MSKFKSKFKFKFKSKLRYVKSKSKPKLRYVKRTTKSKLSYTTLSYNLKLPAPVSDKLFTYLLVLAKNRNVTAYLFSNLRVGLVQYGLTL